MIKLQGSLIVLQFLKDLQAVEASLVVVIQHLGKDVFEKRAEVVGQRNSIFANHLEIGLHFQSLIAGLAHQHLIKYDPQCPNIALLRVEVIHIGLRSHVLWRAYVVEHLRLVGHFIHLAISKINDCDLLADFGLAFKEDIVWLEVAVGYPFVADCLIGLQNLPEDEHHFVFRQAVRCLFQVFAKRASLQEFGNQIDVVFLQDNIEQSHDILVRSIVDFAQITERCNFTAEQVSCHLVIDLLEVDRLDCHFRLRVDEEETQVDVACGSLAQELRVNYCVFIVYGS